MVNKANIKIIIADIQHGHYAEEICQLIAEAAKIRGTGIARRTPEYVRSKIIEGKSVIAIDGEQVVGYCYIETWEHGKYVANSGLIVHPDYRGLKLAFRIKRKVLELSAHLYPEAKVFGITTSNAVLSINFKLGYRPVAFSEITKDDLFWKGCEGCVNYDILQRTQRKMCLCTGMIYEHPANVKKHAGISDNNSNENV
jgi:GNAT superfamily N-acetyltransferase